MSRRRFLPACRSSWHRFRPASRCSTMWKSAASSPEFVSGGVPPRISGGPSNANSAAISKPTRASAAGSSTASGSRRDESAARAKRVPWRRNERLSVAGREVFDWLPIFDLSTEDVFRVIRDAGQSAHWIYRYLSRCSCSFCIFSSPEDPRRAAELRPELYRRYVEIERRIGHTLSPSGTPLPELTGVSPSEAGDGEDAMDLGRTRSPPVPTRRPLARRSSLKPPCPRSGAAQVSR